MRGTVLTLAAAAALGVLVATQAPSAGPLQTTDGAAPGSSWLYPALGEERAVTDPIARPPSGRPPASADPYAAERGRVLRAAYESAVAGAPSGCRLSPLVLAAVGQVESGSAGGRSIGPDHRVDPPIYGPVLDGGVRAAVRDTDGGTLDENAQWDRSMGLMQMLPDTWWTVGVDGDGDGLAHPQNVYDAAQSVGLTLCGGGRDLSGDVSLRDALFDYRASTGFVDAVLSWVAYFEVHGLGALGDLGTARPPELRAAELDTPSVVAALPGEPEVAPSPVRAAGLLSLLPGGSGLTRAVVDLTDDRPIVVTGPPPSAGPTPPPGTTTTVPPGTTTTVPPGTTTTVPPGTTTTVPPGTTTTVPPGTTTTLPPVTTTDPPVTTTDPPVTTTDPPVTTTDPPVTTTDPPVTTTDPPVTTTDPPVTTTDPPVTTTDPPVTTTDPPVTTTDPPAPTTTDTTTDPPTTTDTTTTDPTTP